MPRSRNVTASDVALSEIASIAIHPAIGIARVGNSPDDYFFGPEIPGPHPEDPGNFRDAAGRLKRQAARFCLYARNAAGQVIKEITADDAEITWSVHLANKKAAWYEFKIAMDIPAAMGTLPGSVAMAMNRRNATFTGAARKQLIIDPGPRSLSGRNANPTGGNPAFAFDTGKFFNKPVYLGELRSDEQGNLIVLGGRGAAAAKAGEALVNYANNNGWYDDTADGPVEAVVRIGGKEFKAVGAWVIVGPPNYAPGVPAIVTGYDLVFDVATRIDPTLKPARPAFFKHIYPLLERFTLNQWVNGAFARDFGWGSLNDFRRKDLIALLRNPSDVSRPMRQALFARFRNPAYTVKQPDALPHFYGDATSFNANTRDPREWMAILPAQYAMLKQWANGDFEADNPPKLKPWAQMTPAERAAGLDYAALEETTGGPFHPGCEFTWPLRHSLMYSAPFRFKRRAATEPDWGAQITSATMLKVGGPLDGSAAGDLTRWMAVPWQTDTASCLSAYPFGAFIRDYIPTFWPARVPNDVLTEQNYRILMDANQTQAAKEQAFSLRKRRKWLRSIAYNEAVPASMISNRQAISSMAKDWDKVAIVVRKPGPANTPLFPSEVWVETGRRIGAARELAVEEESLTARGMASPDVLPDMDVEVEPIEDANWADQNPINWR